MENESLRKELKATPDSLTARIRGLNDLTNDLNAYLKLYCMEASKTLKEELESTKATLGGKVQSLEDELGKKDEEREEKVRALTADFEQQSKEMTDKMDAMKSNFIDEKTKLEQRNLE